MSTAVIPATTPPAGPLSARPRLLPGLPVIALPDGSLQLGCDTRRGLRLRNVSAQVTAALHAMDGSSTTATLARLHDCDPDLLAGLVAMLERHDLLVQPEHPALPLQDMESVQVICPPDLAVEVAAGLLGAGAAHLHLVTPHARGLLTDIGRRCAHIRRNGGAGAHVHIAEHVEQVPLDPSIPCVVISGTLETDRALITRLMRAGRPHLVVRPRPRGAMVGPFVVPGRSSCVLCADHYRLAHDPSWTHQMLAMTLTPAPLAPVLVSHLLSSLIETLAAWGRGHVPDLVDHTREIYWDAWTVHTRHWPASATCGCAWQPAQHELADQVPLLVH